MQTLFRAITICSVSLAALATPRLARAAEPLRVHIAPPSCPSGAWTSARWLDAVEAELRSQQIEVAAPTSSAAVTLLPADCASEEAGITVLVSGLGPTRKREVALQDVPSAARPRTVALAVAELIRPGGAIVTPSVFAKPAQAFDPIEIHVESPSPVNLERIAPNGAISTVCESPCNTRVPRDGMYRIDAPGVHTSRTFALDSDAPRASVAVDPGYTKTMIWGIVSMVVGYHVAGVGAYYAAVGAFAEPSPQLKLSQRELDGMATAGTIMLVGGAALGIAGCFMFFNNMKTHVASAPVR